MSNFNHADHPRHQNGAFARKHNSKPGASLGMKLTRQDIIDGLTELIHELHEDGHPAKVQIVGGAAIALTIDAERSTTVDIDGPMVPPEIVRAAAAKIAERRNWREDWINNDAAQFLPNGFGQRGPEWITIHQDDSVTIEVATPEMLLAMKLHSAQVRGARDLGDIYVLLQATGTSTPEEAEELYEQFYPGDQFNAQLQERMKELTANSSRSTIETPLAPRFT